MLAPTIFFLGLNGVFGALTQLDGFGTDSYESFIVPVSMLQGAGFTGAAAGVNLARDIEQGWFDRLLVSPAPRWVLLAGLVLAASFRALIPATFVLHRRALGSAPTSPESTACCSPADRHRDGRGRRLLGLALALRFKTQSAAPLMQAGMMTLILSTTAYAPLALLNAGCRRSPKSTRSPRSSTPRARDSSATSPGAGPGRACSPWPACSQCSARWPCAGCAAPTRERGHRARRAAFLRKNWLEGDAGRRRPFAYTRPSPLRYPWQWYWDSCFAAIVWRRFDPARAARSWSRCSPPSATDGFIGHTIFWDRPVSLSRPALLQRASRRSFQTETIQPPLLAWAWRIAVGDPAAEPRIAAHADWLAANRDLEGDGLLWIVQPDESGLDASPKFDPVWGRRAAAARVPAAGPPQPPARLQRAPHPRRGGPVLCEVSSTCCGRSRCRRWAGPR